MNFKEFKNIAHAGKEGKIRGGGVIYRTQRKISIIISWILIKVFPRILPNHITIGNVIIVFFIFSLIFIENYNNLYYVVFLQLILLNFTSILDKVDGEIARFKKYYTQRGIYYDLLFHFIYPFSLHSSMGYFFYLLSGKNLFILLLGFLLGSLMIVEVAIRKSRHHIKYKIELEKSQKLICDLEIYNSVSSPSSIPLRIVNYLVFFGYDWTWVFYLALIFLSFVFNELSINSFIIYMTISILFIFRKIMVTYPRHLYSKDAFRE